MLNVVIILIFGPPNCHFFLPFLHFSRFFFACLCLFVYFCLPNCNICYG